MDPLVVELYVEFQEPLRVLDSQIRLFPLEITLDK